MKRILLAISLSAAAAKTSQVTDLYTKGDLSAIQQQLAAKKTAFAGKDLERYGNHYTMLAYRSNTGSSEIHEHEADVFVIEEGDAAIILGGKMVGGHTEKPGELRGKSIEGGERRPLKTGDIIHIPAGVPHQILVTPGKPITYFVVKVTGQ
jgi:mannose-6-phosphate isomerase-like protein (cupin superfamily)